MRNLIIPIVTKKVFDKTPTSIPDKSPQQAINRRRLPWHDKGVCRNPTVPTLDDKGLTTVSPKVRTCLFIMYAEHWTGTPGRSQGTGHSIQYKMKAANEERSRKLGVESWLRS